MAPEGRRPSTWSCGIVPSWSWSSEVSSFVRSAPFPLSRLLSRCHLPPHPPDYSPVIESILYTFQQSRILGFVKKTALQAKISNAYGIKASPMRTINKELTGVASICKDGILRLDDKVKAELVAIAADLAASADSNTSRILESYTVLSA